MTAIDPDQLLAALLSRISAIPRRWAESTPDASALHDGQRHWSYAELTSAVEDTAARRVGGIAVWRMDGRRVEPGGPAPGSI